jgi:hypothetical protein
MTESKSLLLKIQNFFTACIEILPQKKLVHKKNIGIIVLKCLVEPLTIKSLLVSLGYDKRQMV